MGRRIKWTAADEKALAALQRKKRQFDDQHRRAVEEIATYAPGISKLGREPAQVTPAMVTFWLIKNADQLVAALAPYTKQAMEAPDADPEGS